MAYKEWGMWWQKKTVEGKNCVNIDLGIIVAQNSVVGVRKLGFLGCGELWQQNRHLFFFNVYDIFGVMEICVGVADLVVTFLIIWKQI